MARSTQIQSLWSRNFCVSSEHTVQRTGVRADHNPPGTMQPSGATGETAEHPIHGSTLNSRCQSVGTSVGSLVQSVIALLGVAALGATCGCTSASASTSPTAASPAAAIHVDTHAVSARPVPVWLTLTGQLKGARETDLAANTTGRVVKTLVERGDVVKAGQPLAILDTRAAALSLKEAHASAESAAASAENAKLNCARYQALAETGAISQSELERTNVQCQTSELGVAAARARAALIGQSVGDGIIRAPFAGSVAERYVEVGEYVRSDSKVVTLVDLSAMRLEFTLPEANVAAARPSAKLRFTVAGYPDRQFEGTVKYVGAQVRPTTRDIVAEAIVDTPDVALRPGMFASVQLANGTHDAPVVPRGSLVERDGKFVAFVASNGVVEERIVHVGESLGDEAAVTRGLAAGERVVVAPSPELKNGQRIL